MAAAIKRENIACSQEIIETSGEEYKIKILKVIKKIPRINRHGNESEG